MSPPPRRRSARLASATKPKATPELPSLVEYEESPERKPIRAVHGLSSPQPTPATPASSSLKPPHSEMHPSKVHSNTVAPSSALRLGFTDIKTADRRGSQHGSGLDSTPTKIGGVPSSSFTFRVNREAADTELSSGAQRMMEEIREQASRIKADLVAQWQAEKAPAPIGERAIAKPKGRSGRYSAAHMADFKKMDSIEGHASAWRAQNGRFTPVKSSLKRSPSKANLDATPTSHKSNARQSPSKPVAVETPNARPKHSLKRTSSVANLDSQREQPTPKRAEIGTTPVKSHTPAKGAAVPPVKRLKQRFEDDASTTRPKSRDGSSLPRATQSGNSSSSAIQTKTSLSRLLSPTKSLTAQLANAGKSTVSLVAASPKTNYGALTRAKPVETSSRTLDLKRRIISPGRFQKVKSILRGSKFNSDNAMSAILQPTIMYSQTPAPPRVNKEIPVAPLTTPRRKLTKHVTFTPETARASLDEDSPSPRKEAIAARVRPTRGLNEVQFAGLDGVLAKTKTDEVVYPDLSSFRHLIESHAKELKASAPKVSAPSVPGSFTFRSDHTIKFGGPSRSGFGASPGQASVRHVRDNAEPISDMPGRFPETSPPRSHPNKENAAPSSTVKLLPGVPHGMTNKKRHRASSDDDDADSEAADRAGKKRKNEHVAEGQAMVAPRPAKTASLGSVKKILFDRAPTHTPGRTPSRAFSRTPSRTPSKTPSRTPGGSVVPTGSATPSKKRAMISMSRLNMLARPKNRV